MRERVVLTKAGKERLEDTTRLVLTLGGVDCSQRTWEPLEIRKAKETGFSPGLQKKWPCC